MILFNISNNVLDTDDWSLGHIPVVGSEEICIGGQRLRLISAPVNLIHNTFVHIFLVFVLQLLSNFYVFLSQLLCSLDCLRIEVQPNSITGSSAYLHLYRNLP